jgi:cellulose biosynthesis protein BcsQ
VRIVAVAHLKGGVGKSTTTLFLAEHWALAGDRVLVIDLDPQSNSSFMLLSREGLTNWEHANKTLPDLFRDVRSGEHRGKFAEYVVPRGSDLLELTGAGSRGQVSVLPSIPRLWFEEYEFDKLCHRNGSDPTVERMAVLRDLLRDMASSFEFVLIDCPPGFGSLTRAGICLADAIITPTIPDYVSTRSLADFFEYGLRRGLNIDPRETVNLVISKFTGTNFQKNVLDLLRHSYSVIEPPLRMKDDVLWATEHIEGRVRNYGEKYPDTIRSDVRAMATEARRRIIGSRRNQERRR